MNTALQTPKHQQSFSEWENIFSRLFWSVKNNTQDALDNSSDSPEETLLFMVYTWKFSQVNHENDNEKDFYNSKRSSAQDEWCMKISALHTLIPLHMKNFLEDLYENEKVVRWTNHDDIAFYNYNGEYLWRKFRVIFYNSCDYSRDGGKKPFENLLVEDQSIRICWYKK